MQMSFDPDGASGLLTPGPWGGGSGGVGYAASATSAFLSENLKDVKKFLNDVGMTICSGAEKLYDAYMRGYSIQQQCQYQELLAKQQLYEDVHEYISDEEFWSTDVGIVIQSIVVGAGVGATRGFVSSIPSAAPLLLVSPQAALATIGGATLHGLLNGAIDGFFCGIAVIAIW